MNSFAGKNVVVTGAASGIGLAITLTLAERGATLWTVDLSLNPPDDLGSWIKAGKVHFEGGIDVGDRVSCRKYMEKVVSTAGRLDGLVNNAGIGLFEGPIASYEAYDRTIHVNIGGVWNYGTAALRVMEKQEPQGPWNSRGSIVNIASGAGLRGVSGLAVYCATKHAVIGLSRAWQEDFGKFGIRTNSVAPGKQIRICERRY
jgi:NAD(P)-dependent dehydrogenase (short-subunit alcohol dehydrogenase family)